MSENQDRPSEALENLEQMLLGSLNADGAGSESGDDFNRLQEMLVDPELLKMRDRVFKIEQEITDVIEMREKIQHLEEGFDALEDIRYQVEQLERYFKQLDNKIDRPKDIIKVIIPIMSNIVNRQLREFKKEIIQEIVPIIKQYQEEQRKLSIRVVGVSAENQDSSY
jgi:hypothetical protein